MIFQRRETLLAHELLRGEYLQVPPGTRFIYGVLCCPDCGRPSSIGRGRNHTVADDGTVTPSYVCPFPPCGFHQMIRLADWKP